MSSRARAGFRSARIRSQRLLAISTDRRLRPITYADAEPALHAALASLVSAWEGYVEAVTLEAIDAVASGASSEVLWLTSLLREEAVRAVEKFNTPSAENCRMLLLKFTGFDAFSVMASPRLSLPASLARTRLNEILRVRHAFAHGFPIPSYSWTTRYGTQNRLTKRAVRDSQKLIEDFVDRIDVDLAAHIRTAFPSRAVW